MGKNKLLAASACAVLALIFVLSVLLTHNPAATEHPYNMSGLDTRQLMDKARRCVAEGKPDSAIMLYQAAADINPGNGDTARVRRRAAAYNNIGYVLFYGKQDYLNAYSYFLESRYMAERSRYAELLPYIYLNIGNVKAGTEADSALSMYRMSFAKAIGLKEYGIARIAYANLVSLAIHEGRLDSVKPDMAAFDGMPADTASALGAYATLCHEGAEAMSAEDYGLAARYFGMSAGKAAADGVPDRYRLQALGNIVMAYVAGGDYAAAAGTLGRLERAAAKANAADIRRSVYMAYGRVYDSIGDMEAAGHYRLRSLEMSDSFYNFRKGYELKSIESRGVITRMSERYKELDESNARNRTAVRVTALVAVTVMLFAVMTLLFKRKSDRLLKALYVKNRELLLKVQDSGGGKAAPEGCGDKERHGAAPMPGTLVDSYARRLTEVVDSSDEIYSVGFSVSRLARLSGLHEKEVSRVINEKWGMNFNAWLNEYRCKEACRRLPLEEYSNLTIEAIAGTLGFRSRSHFASVFRKTTGMSPSEYRKASRL